MEISTQKTIEHVVLAEVIAIRTSSITPFHVKLKVYFWLTLQLLGMDRDVNIRIAVVTHLKKIFQ